MDVVINVYKISFLCLSFYPIFRNQKQFRNREIYSNFAQGTSGNEIRISSQSFIKQTCCFGICSLPISCSVSSQKNWELKHVRTFPKTTHYRRANSVSKLYFKLVEFWSSIFQKLVDRFPSSKMVWIVITRSRQQRSSSY